MTVIADITLPADAFVLGRVLADYPDARVEHERIVPLAEGVMPLFWVSGVRPGRIADALRRSPRVDAVAERTSRADETLFEVAWSDDVDGVVRALCDTHATVLEATGTGSQWEFRLRFHSHDDLSAFNVALTDDQVPVTLRHLSDSVPASDDIGLTAAQRDALVTAYQRGFFEVPRSTTLEALAAELDVSDSALSQRLRRGLSSVLSERLFDDASGRHEP